MASLKDKIGYGFGDMASSMFWKIFSYYLPFFYAHIFGIGLAHAAVLFLVTRIWDAVSDPMMGIIADRTQTRWGKYRPYVLWFAIPSRSVESSSSPPLISRRPGSSYGLM